MVGFGIIAEAHAAYTYHEEKTSTTVSIADKAMNISLLSYGATCLVSQS